MGLAGITNPGPHGLSQIPLTPSPRRQATMAPPSRASTPILAGTTRLSVSPCSAAASLMMIPHGRPLPVISPQKEHSALAWHLPREYGRSSPSCSPASFSSVGALTFFPALSLGPILEHLLLQHGTLFSLRQGTSISWLKSKVSGIPTFSARPVIELPYTKPDPRLMMKNPVHVRCRGRQRRHHRAAY